MKPQTEILDAAQHADLKKISMGNFPHVQSQQLVQINLHEFPPAGTCYPLFFIKDRTSGRLFPIALLGLVKGQNLYRGADGWGASYVPLCMQNWPFSMQATGEDNQQQWQVAADIHSPYLSKTEGDALFTAGQPSEVLQRITKGLINESQQKVATVQFMDFLMQHNLIKPIKFALGFADGDKQQVDGIYAIDEDALLSLSPEQVQEMYQKDYFKAVYCMLGSQHNLYELIKRSQANGEKTVTSLDILNHL